MQSFQFGRMPDGEAIHAFTLRGDTGLTATVIQYGGRLASLQVPTPTGPRNVTLGFDTLDPYLADVAHLGAITGRYANRIAHGRFALDGRSYQLPLNNGRNTLHGGPGGFASRVWRAEPDGEALVLSLHSADGDQGFPGALDVSVRYRLDGDALAIDYDARADAPTVLNLTSHAYFNLAGAGTIMNHELHIESERYLPVDAELIPTGELRAVAGTAFDFGVASKIGARIDSDDAQLRLGGGYDHCFVLSDTPRERPHAAVRVTAGGIRMEVLTTEPGVQLYSGNFLSSARYPWRTGMCLETQHFPDSPNQPRFPATTLRPGEQFTSHTSFRFRV